MAVVALVALVCFAAVAFGWRMWLQHRRTGDSGLRGSSRSVPEILGGLGLLPGTLAIVLAPVLDIAGVISPLDPLVHPVAQGSGIACFVFGFVLTVRAQLDMGASWRIGVDTKETTSLVTGGVFRHVRNPIFTGMVVAFLGVALLVPSALAFIGIALIVIGLEIHVRYVEEPYLLTVHGDAYRAYARAAGRFVPGWGRAGR